VRSRRASERRSDFGERLAPWSTRWRLRAIGLTAKRIPRGARGPRSLAEVVQSKTSGDAAPPDRSDALPFGRSPGSISPWRLQPTRASQVRARATGRGPLASALGGARHPANHGAEEQRSISVPTPRCFLTFIKTYTSAWRPARGARRARAWYLSPQTRPRRPRARFTARARRMASPRMPEDRARPWLASASLVKSWAQRAGWRPSLRAG
jgi:hypothetical protein